jgi:branched-chain amino acid transport system ATP-binding protein
MGNVRFRGQEITGWLPHRVNRAGIGYVPENRRIFADLTVRENLDVAQRRTSERNQWTIEKVYALFPVLKDRTNSLGGLLSGGEQQMLAVARALVGNPELILMDEVTEGLSPIIVQDIEEQLLTLKEIGVSILLSMQDAIFAMKQSDKAYIIEKGEIKYHSTIEELRENESVIRKYLTL